MRAQLHRLDEAVFRWVAWAAQAAMGMRSRHIYKQVAAAAKAVAVPVLCHALVCLDSSQLGIVYRFRPWVGSKAALHMLIC